MLRVPLQVKVSRLEKIERRRRPFYSFGQRLVADALAMQMRRALIEMSNRSPGEWHDAIGHGVRHTSVIMADAVDAIWRQTGEYFAETTYREVLGLAGKAIKQPEWLERVLNRAVGEFGDRIKLLDKDTIKTLRKLAAPIMDVALKEGWGIDKIVRALREIFNGFEPYTDKGWRVKRVVQTEVVGASNWASHVGAQQAGTELGIVLIKEWLSINADDRTRDLDKGDSFDHVHMHMEHAAMDEPFQVPSEFGAEPLMYPGDPSGSPGNIINCRCSVAYVPADMLEGQ